MRREEARLKLLSLLPKNGIGMEIGVHRGLFSRYLLDITKPKKLFLIDPWECVGMYGSQYGDCGPQVMEERYACLCEVFHLEVSTGRVEIHRGKSTEIVHLFGDDTLDFVYVDGDHTYAAVENDLRMYWPKVKVSGCLAGDDYGVAGWWGDGVTHAIDDFVKDKTNYKIIDTQFIVWKSE